MSEEQKESDQQEDPELNDLLDSALKDFDKPPKSSSIKKKEENEPSSNVSLSTEVSKESVPVGEMWSEDFIAQAAAQFETNIQQLLQNGSESDIGKSFKEMAQSIMTENADGNAESLPPDFQSAINQALKDLSSDNLQNVTNISEADLAAMFGQASLDDASGDIFPFMQGMMQSLFSKDVLYPAIKDLVDKYPAWLEEKRDSLPSDELERFEKQFDLMKKVCSELETEKEEDSEEIRKKRFQQVLSLMQEMQTCGQPPEDLVGDQQTPFQVDAEGNPVIPGLGEAPNCSVM